MAAAALRTERRSLARLSNLAAHLRENPEISLADVAYTLSRGAEHFAADGSSSAATPEEALAALVAGLPHSPPPESRLVVFLFPGQGSQQRGDGARALSAEPVFREEIDRCAKLLLPTWT